MFSFDNVCRRFGDTAVLDGFSVSFDEGRVTCILGASGCGKTTLLRLASGLDRPDSGRVELPSGKYSFLFQENRLFPWLTALKNLTAVGISAGEAERWLRAVGLSDSAQKLPSELSGGMQRKLAIARALAYGGGCFFLDEPIQGLDEETAAGDELRGRTALVVTHHLGAARSLADRTLTVGGSPLRVLSDERA